MITRSNLLSLGLVISCCSSSAALERLTAQVEVLGRPFIGTPLVWNSQHVVLLARDGQTLTFKTPNVKNPQQVSDQFRPLTQAEVRFQLLAEFGQGFDVTGTGNYLVVHPAGQQNLWADRFEQLYRSMVHYFMVRGFQVTEPTFPMVAVVFPSQSEFTAYARATGSEIPSDTLGYYSSSTNRVLMYDSQRGQAGQENWTTNAATIIHEAAHQTAHNTGIHSRFAPAPTWVKEGIGTLFEAPGVYDSGNYEHQSDRVNREYLADFRQTYGQSIRQGAIADLVASDQMFKRNSTEAYALCWALTFTLVEHEPQRYAEYLKLTASRPAYQPYSAAERIRDFVGVFGADWDMMQANVERLMSGL